MQLMCGSVGLGGAEILIIVAFGLFLATGAIGAILAALLVKRMRRRDASLPPIIQSRT